MFDSNARADLFDFGYGVELLEDEFLQLADAFDRQPKEKKVWRDKAKGLSICVATRRR